LVSSIAGLQRMPLPHGRRVAIVGGAGGGSVTMTDAAERANLLVPQLSDETIAGLSEFVPVHGQSVKNPLDIFSVLVNYDHFMRMIELLRDDPNIDALVYLQRVEWALRRDRIFLDMALQMAIDGSKALKKPLVIALAAAHSLEGELLRKEAQRKYASEGIATFPSFEAAATTVYNLSEYQRYLSSTKSS
jgi:acyl-CoA synthetase (NDP forming)